jgi:hypothetical protein
VTHEFDVFLQHSMHLFWEVAEFIGNTLVFFVFGVIIAERIYVGYNPEGDTDAILRGEDWGWAMLNWVLLNAIRFVTLVVLKPVMSRIGEEFTWVDVIVATWAGLRGAVGLSLGLLVYLTSVAPNSRIDAQCASLPSVLSSPRLSYHYHCSLLNKNKWVRDVATSCLFGNVRCHFTHRNSTAATDCSVPSGSILITCAQTLQQKGQEGPSVIMFT